MPALVFISTLALVAAAPVDAGAPPADGAAPAGAPSLIAPPRKSAPPADRHYELRRATDGSGDLVYEGAGYRARIARDGTARFEDKHFSLLRSWSLLPFAPTPTPTGRPSLQSTFQDLFAHRKPRPGAAEVDPPAEPLPLKPRMSPYRPDPNEACRYPDPCFDYYPPVIVVAAAGSFDLTDELMRLHHQDPYRYEKAHFLAATAELRGALAARALAENVRRERRELPARLEALACDETRPARERRATIEALRREFDGDAPAARAAVAVIDHFVEARFPAGGGAPLCPSAPSAPSRPGSR